MDKSPLKNGFHKDDSIYMSIADVVDGEHKNKMDDSAQMNDSTIIAGSVLNQSVIISGSLMNDIHDISNNCSIDELNTNIDALTPDKKDIFPEEESDVEILSEKAADKALKSHCMRGYNTHQPFPRNKSDLPRSISLDTVEPPEVEITSCEDSNGKFRVKFHIKGAKK